ncbi:MAG: Hsp20 family protein, partial [Thermoplasmata archaeon]|nr:Hsp20 family protein [Thermoplasmata archaeon]
MVRTKRDGEIVPRTENMMPFTLSDEIDRMFGDLDSWFWGPSFALTPRMATHGMRVPRINVKEESDAFIVSAEMPGVRKEDLELNMHENVLEISARESQETKEEDEKTGYIY